MLLRPERRLVEADPGLPGLGVLLDTRRLTEWLTLADPRITAVERRYVRYKKGTSCLVGLRLTVDGEQHGASVLGVGVAGVDKLTKTRDRARRGAVIAADERLHLLATTPAADRDLPALAQFLEDRRRPRLLAGLLPQLDLRGHGIETLSHKPHRRWVGLLTTRAGERVVLRAYPPDEIGRRRRAIDALADGRPPTPAVLGSVSEMGLLAVEYLPGASLDRALRTGRARRTRLAGAGAALALLHDRDPSSLSLPERTLADECRAVELAAGSLADLLPGCSSTVGALAEAITGRLGQDDSGQQHPLHGDFSVDQVVLGQDGKVAVVDLDSAAIGDPAIDLACATADLAAMAVRDEDGEVEQRRADALLEGYGAVLGVPCPERLAVHTAAQLLRRAVDPFRLCQADWPTAVEALVDRAVAALAPSGRVRGTR